MSYDGIQPKSNSEGLVRHSVPEGPADDETIPSILREYDYSFLRICGYTVLGAATLIGCLMLLFLLS